MGIHKAWQNVTIHLIRNFLNFNNSLIFNMDFARINFLLKNINNISRNFRCHIFIFLFHVEHYLPIYIKSTLTSEGETPLIREASPIVSGILLFNFCLASVESDFRPS